MTNILLLKRLKLSKEHIPTNNSKIKIKSLLLNKISNLISLKLIKNHRWSILKILHSLQKLKKFLILIHTKSNHKNYIIHKFKLKMLCKKKQKDKKDYKNSIPFSKVFIKNLNQ